MWHWFKFDNADKWYMHKPESVQKNQTHKILWDFEIQTENPILARRLDLKIKERKMISNYLDIAGDLKRPWNMKMTVIPIVFGTLGMVLKDMEIKTLDQRKNSDHPDHHNSKIGKYS